ncbi:hypothetical protein ACRALDRAFT_2030352 [Sodiomyces alcalophilus JCM 7366]|uniref:uncharacterized protein n=1 Tax=Sodiomyces alcalophilus JCM 7366 TaxID=591952 RepID=UPI0039B418DF
MSLLNVHLEQIALSCQGIDSLPFPRPKIFTNALLHNDDITSLIRDTEPHERALFSVPPPPPSAVQSSTAKPEGDRNRRKTVFAVSSGEVTTGGGITGRPAHRNTAVASVLGGELHDKIARRPYGSSGSGDARGGAKHDVDVDILLRGAEKLCRVYAPPGALERVSALRGRWARSGGTLAYYEARVAEQTEALEALNRGHWMDEAERGEEREEEGGGWEEGDDGMTEEELRAEEEEVRELDRKKRELQERLRAMEKDLGGLLHM